jgi:mono/diheme cytochrome c family protein
MNWTKSISLSAAALMMASPAFANNKVSDGQITFTKDILPILQENCQDCHRPNGANLGGMVAPMSFTTYEDARPWAKSIAKEVAARNMPPWDATPEFHGVFRNERVLSEDQIETIVAWAQNGAKRGNPADAPAAREFSSSDGWQIGEPDLILSMPEKYFVKDDVEDIYVDFYAVVTEEMLPEPRYIKAIEFKPGSPVVHHIISDPLGGIAPGNGATFYPEGYGKILKPGARVSFEMHYHKEAGPGTGVWDQSQAAVKFYPVGYTPEHEVRMAMLGNFDFEIPAGDPNYTVTAEEAFNRDTQILSYTPHMHLRGKSALYKAFLPDGKEEVLLDVPAYDFNWQTTYWYDELKVLPAGSKMEVALTWDNSAENPSNPDPTKNVTWGEPTTSEMMFGFVQYAFVEEPEGLSIELMERYTGQYAVGPMKFNVGGWNGQLSVYFQNREFSLAYESKHKFAIAGVGVEFTFVPDEDGNVSTLMVKMGGETHEAKRVEQTNSEDSTD